MNEKDAIDYASEHGIVVTEDWRDRKTKALTFKVGDLRIESIGFTQFWKIGDTGVQVHRRGNAIKYAVDHIVASST